MQPTNMQPTNMQTATDAQPHAADEDPVLLVEDNPGDARLTRTLLEVGAVPAPAGLLWVQTLEAAVRQLQSGAPCRAVLLDLGLPGCQGLDAFHALRLHATACPVIVLTGDDSEAVGMAAVAAGAQDFLVKGSFDGGLLRRCIRFSVQRKRAELALIAQALAAQETALNSAQRLNEAMGRVADAFVAIDKAGHFTYVNARAVQLLGCQSEAELLGRQVWTEFPNALGTPFQGAFEQAMQSQQPVANEGYFPPSQRWLDGRLYPSANGLSMYFTDITDRRASEQALLQIQFEVSELAHRLLVQEKTTTQRVAQALHDHLGQTLAAARLNLDACVTTHGAAMPPALKAQGARIAALLDQAVLEVRQVLSDLRPPLLQEQGLPAALDNEIRHGALASQGGGTGNSPASAGDAGGVDVWLEVDAAARGQRWPDDIEYAAFMVAREAIANVRLHARATLVRVVLEGDARELRLQVIDDGTGIPTPLLGGRAGHLGLVGMRERALAIGAQFDVTNAQDGGTQVSLRWGAPPP